jgi:hypothetical protein
MTPRFEGHNVNIICTWTKYPWVIPNNILDKNQEISKGLFPSDISTVACHQTKLLLWDFVLESSNMYVCMCMYCILSVTGVLGMSWLHQFVLPSSLDSCRAFAATVMALGPTKSPPYFTPTSNPILRCCLPPMRWTVQVGLLRQVSECMEANPMFLAPVADLLRLFKSNHTSQCVFSFQSGTFWH